jgi:hypothetical protein
MRWMAAVACVLSLGCAGAEFTLDKPAPLEIGLPSAPTSLAPSTSIIGVDASDEAFVPCAPSRTCVGRCGHNVSNGCGVILNCGDCPSTQSNPLNDIDAAVSNEDSGTSAEVSADVITPVPDSAAGDGAWPCAVSIPGVGSCGCDDSGVRWGCFSLPGTHGPMLACCRSYGAQSIGGECSPVPLSGTCQ